MAGPLAPSPRPTPLNYKKKIFFVDSLFAQITLLSIDTPVAWLLTIKCEKKMFFFFILSLFVNTLLYGQKFPLAPILTK